MYFRGFCETPANRGFPESGVCQQNPRKPPPGIWDFPATSHQGIWGVSAKPATETPTKRGFKQGDFPNAEEYYQQAISLPIFPTLTENEQNHVISVLQECLTQ